MTPAFIVLHEAPASAPRPFIIPTAGMCVSLAPDRPWVAPLVSDGFDCGGSRYSFDRYNRWCEARGGPFIRMNIPREEIDALFAAYLAEEGPKLKAAHDDLRAGRSVVTSTTGVKAIVLESLDEIVRLLGAAVGSAGKVTP